MREIFRKIVNQYLTCHQCLLKCFRAYYESQLELITSIEDILVPKSDETKDHATAYEKRYNRNIKILTMVTLVTNIVCSISYFDDTLLFISH